MKVSKNKKRNGFTLIEILLVITILMGLVTIEIRKQMSAGDEQLAIAVGRQASELGRAVEKYIALRLTELQSATIPASECTPTALPNSCELNMSTLRAYGFIPTESGSGGANTPISTPFGVDFKVYLRRYFPPAPTGSAASICTLPLGSIPLGCNDPATSAPPAEQAIIQALVILEDPWRKGGAGAIEWTTLGRAVKEIGPAGGVSKGNELIGFNGGYAVPSTDFNAIAEGQLGLLVSSSANMWNKFVRRDGSLPMVGNLNVGGNKILNMQDMFLNGPDTNRRNKNISSLVPNWVYLGNFMVRDGYTVQKPTCPTKVTSGVAGTPQIKILLSGLDPSFGLLGHDGRGQSFENQQSQQSSDSVKGAYKAQSGWYIYANGQNPDGSDSLFWTISIQVISNSDGTNARVTPGSGIAEIYCTYGDQV